MFFIIIHFSTLFSASNKTNMKMISHNTGAMIEFADKVYFFL